VALVQCFAKVLAQAGAQVVLASRRIDRLKELRAEIESEGVQRML
jgi:NADP-dependent 3-hydroxy acid dehydrogenase YdfG